MDDMTHGGTGGMIHSRFLQTCDITDEVYRVEPFTMVIFGGAGDLSRRKLIPALFSLFLKEELKRGFSVLAVGRTEMSDGAYRASMEEALRTHAEVLFDDRRWSEFSGRLFYIPADLGQDAAYAELFGRIREVSVSPSGPHRNVIYYMALPPHSMPVVVGGLERHGLSKGDLSTRIITEKPFGTDRPSAMSLNKVLTSAFDEEQIYRIDHYLGKEPVQNILFFRFSNTIFEEIWHAHYVDNVQITVAEEIGIEHRGEFYEQAGVVRDIVQNHMLQLVGLTAMDAPVGFKADFIRDEKLKILRSIRPLEGHLIDRHTVRGQYGRGIVGGHEVPSYREEGKVSPRSNTATYFAARFHIDNLRWAGVPFYVRAGKRLAKRVTEICLQFKNLPLRLFGRTCDILEPNVLVLTIQPEEKISLRFGVKYPFSPNQIYPVNMVFDYRETFKGTSSPAYERLILECIRGDLTLFVRQDEVAAMWEIVDPIVKRWAEAAAVDFPNYASGTWGPEEAERLLAQEGRHWITA
jgi:glucose-6-phosphate 1-dehydrogenase